MKHFVFAALVLAAIGVCGSTAQAQSSDYSNDMSVTDIRLIKEALDVVQANDVRNRQAINLGAERLTHDSYSFIGAHVFTHNGAKYATIRTIDTSIIDISKASDSEWEMAKKVFTTRLSRAAEVSDLEYTIDEETRQVTAWHPNVCYGVVQDDGQWKLYPQAKQTGVEPEVMAIFKQASEKYGTHLRAR